MFTFFTSALNGKSLHPNRESSYPKSAEMFSLTALRAATVGGRLLQQHSFATIRTASVSRPPDNKNVWRNIRPYIYTALRPCNGKKKMTRMPARNGCDLMIYRWIRDTWVPLRDTGPFPVSPSGREFPLWLDRQNCGQERPRHAGDNDFNHQWCKLLPDCPT